MAIEISSSHIMPPDAELYAGRQLSASGQLSVDRQPSASGQLSVDRQLSASGQGKAAAAGGEQKDGTQSGGILDEYTKSETSETKPSGMYRFEQDEHGNRKLVFDDPKKDAKTCTGNTDQVDREIRKLKEKAQQLKQQIQAASGDEKKVSDLVKKLAQVQSELSRKDNDTYRRQHTIFS